MLGTSAGTIFAQGESVRPPPTNARLHTPGCPIDGNGSDESAAAEFHLGAAQVAVLWRLMKADVASRAIVMDDANGMRLVVVEAERIVQWERFAFPSELRARASAIQTDRRRRGWR
jgi:hypothetical protein